MKVSSFFYDTSYSPSAPVVTIQVRRQRTVELIALVDSGADATILPLDILETVGAQPLKTTRMRGITGASQRVGLYVVTIQISRHILPSIQAVAATRGSEAIIGRDVLNHLIITLNGLAGVTEIEV